jgi:hypothetical protein
MGPLINWTNAIRYAKDAKNYKEFLQKVSEYDMAHIENNFKTYLENYQNGKVGLENRIKRRLENSLGMKIESTPPSIPNEKGQRVNDTAVQNNVVKMN